MSKSQKIKSNPFFLAVMNVIQSVYDEMGLQGVRQLVIMTMQRESSINALKWKKSPLYEIVVFGNKGVGKSSSVSQYLDTVFPVTRKVNSFNPHYQSFSIADQNNF